MVAQKALVIGLGESGRAAAELLHQLGAQVVVRDEGASEVLSQRSEILAKKGIRVELGSGVQQGVDADIAVLSPGISLEADMMKPVREAGIPVISEIELAWLYFQGKTIAITGTNGKSTTTGLIEEMLKAGGMKAEACGNIGTPFSDVVMKEDPVDVAVVEVSSFQLEAIDTFRPDVAVYLNFTPDHLDRYQSLNEYRAAKDRIFVNMDASQKVIVQKELIWDGLLPERINFDVSGGDAEYQWVDGMLIENGEPVIHQSETSLHGPHNAENQLAALAVAKEMGIDDAARRAALQSYQPLAHRCEFVAEWNGVQFINDSKSTNPDSLRKAVEGYASGVHLIAGGKDKGFSYADLAELLRPRCSAVYLIGQMAVELERVWKQAVDCILCRSLEEAVHSSAAAAKSGEVVLFSPGCSSFDMFQNFQDRGNQFRQAVHRLTQNIAITGEIQ